MGCDVALVLSEELARSRRVWKEEKRHDSRNDSNRPFHEKDPGLTRLVSWCFTIEQAAERTYPAVVAMIIYLP